MHFDLIQSISLAGDSTKANDDRCGAADRHAWIVDGATDLGEPGLLGGRGGAAWLAGEADRAFAAAKGPIDAICREVFDHVAAQYAAQRTRDPVAAWELPSAGFLAIGLGDGTLDCAWLGDCAGLLIRYGVPARIGPQPERAGEIALASSVAAHGLGTIRPAPVLAALRAARENPARKVLGVDPRGIERLHTARIAALPGDDVLLMTDGFAEMIDSYALVTPAELAALLPVEGLNGLATRIRAAEAEDANCTRWPRFKRGDDATALWVRIVA